VKKKYRNEERIELNFNAKAISEKETAELFDQRKNPAKLVELRERLTPLMRRVAQQQYWRARNNGVTWLDANDFLSTCLDAMVWYTRPEAPLYGEKIRRYIKKSAIGECKKLTVKTRRDSIHFKQKTNDEMDKALPTGGKRRLGGAQVEWDDPMAGPAPSRGETVEEIDLKDFLLASAPEVGDNGAATMMRMLIEGYMHKEIAEVLKVSESTVKRAVDKWFLKTASLKDMLLRWLPMIGNRRKAKQLLLDNLGKPHAEIAAALSSPKCPVDTATVDSALCNWFRRVAEKNPQFRDIPDGMVERHVWLMLTSLGNQRIKPERLQWFCDESVYADKGKRVYIWELRRAFLRGLPANERKAWTTPALEAEIVRLGYMVTRDGKDESGSPYLRDWSLREGNSFVGQINYLPVKDAHTLSTELWGEWDEHQQHEWTRIQKAWRPNRIATQPFGAIYGPSGVGATI
jgi:hypothetical protein